MCTWLLVLQAITPIHSGTGQSVGIVDLPIARERATGWPILPASGIKGVLRDEADKRASKLSRLFGDEKEASTLCFGDQRILFLAVRSYFGTYAYVTCPLVLQRLARDAEALKLGLELDVPQLSDNEAMITSESQLIQQSTALEIFLEDINLSAKIMPEAQIATLLAEMVFPSSQEKERKTFMERLAIVPNNVFSFLCETATEIVARIRLEEDTKTVASGALWYEEAVPAESIFCGPVLCNDNAEEVKNFLSATTLVQVGGDATVGRGLCRVQLWPA